MRQAPLLFFTRPGRDAAERLPLDEMKPSSYRSAAHFWRKNDEQVGEPPFRDPHFSPFSVYTVLLSFRLRPRGRAAASGARV